MITGKAMSNSNAIILESVLILAENITKRLSELLRQRLREHFMEGLSETRERYHNRILGYDKLYPAMGNPGFSTVSWIQKIGISLGTTLAISHLQTRFDEIAADDFFKTLMPKVKLPMMSDFSFGHNVFNNF